MLSIPEGATIQVTGMPGALPTDLDAMELLDHAVAISGAKLTTFEDPGGVTVLVEAGGDAAMTFYLAASDLIEAHQVHR